MTENIEYEGRKRRLKRQPTQCKSCGVFTSTFLGFVEPVNNPSTIDLGGDLTRASFCCGTTALCDRDGADCRGGCCGRRWSAPSRPSSSDAIGRDMGSQSSSWVQSSFLRRSSRGQIRHVPRRYSRRGSSRPACESLRSFTLVVAPLTNCASMGVPLLTALLGRCHSRANSAMKISLLSMMP